MNALSRAASPAREVIAPRHESLWKAFRAEREAAEPGYGEARLWLVARDAGWLFAYWDFDPAEHPEACDAQGVQHFFLRVVRENGEVEMTAEIFPHAGNWYLPVKQADCAYSAELGFFTTGGAWAFVARSGSTRTLPAGIPAAAPRRVSLGEIRAHLAGEANAEEVARCVREELRRSPEWTAEHEQMLARLLRDESSPHAAAEVRRKIEGR